MQIFETNTIKHPLIMYSTNDCYQFIKKIIQIPTMQLKCNKEFHISKSNWEKKYMNVQHTWTIVSNHFGFDVKQKHIVIGFYSVRNKTTAIYNLLLSVVTLKIYKNKMF